MSQAEQELNDLFQHIRSTCTSELDKGRAYERIIRDFLKNDSEFKDFYVEVLSWIDFTLKYGGDQNDTGIDLVAKDKNEEFTAIQCKFYDEDASLPMGDTDSFFRKVGAKHVGRIAFSHKIIATTAGKLAPNLIKHIEDDENTKVIGKDKLIYSNIDWKIYLNQDEVKLRTKFDPKPHQEEAINAVIEGFKEADRGKLIMACGTGKTLTAKDAKARFGIQQLSARMSEFKAAGLVVKTDVATTGATRYGVVARDVNGSRAKVFAE